MTDHKKEFVKIFQGIDFSKSRYEVFHDFVTLSFCSLAKAALRGVAWDDRVNKLEDRYMGIVKTYNRNLDFIRNDMPKLLAHAAMGIDTRCDFLGEVYSDLEIYNKELGQFFTPFSLSYMNAKLVVGDLRGELRASKKKYITVHEPAAGSGGMLLALKAVMQDQKINAGKCLWFEAIDLSEIAFMMCYIQTSLAGLPGRVTHGNTLSREIFDSYVTPQGYEFLRQNGNPFKEQDGGCDELQNPARAHGDVEIPYTDLFSAQKRIFS